MPAFLGAVAERESALRPVTDFEAILFFYRAYGRVIESNVQIPGFHVETSREASVTISWTGERDRTVPWELGTEPAYTAHWHPPGGGNKPFSLYRVDSGSIVRWEGLCDFEIPYDGSMINCRPYEGVEWGDVNPFVQGRILPLALNYQGAVTLHGAAVEVEGGVAALLGNSGAGKSTLSASFHALGHKLVADDLVAVWQDGCRPVVEWGPGHVRLDANSLKYVTTRLSGSLRSEPDYDKTRVELRSPDSCISARLPLRTIYLLQRARSGELKEPVIETLSAVDALPTIMNGISNRTILDRAHLAQQFELIGGILSRVPVKHLRYPSGMELLPRVCETVNADREV